MCEYHTEEYSMYEGRIAAEPGITFGELRGPNTWNVVNE